MCVITATEFKKNLGKYLDLSRKEPVHITKNGKVYTTLDASKNTPEKSAMRFRGCLGSDPNIDYDKLLYEEIAKRCGF